MTATSDNSDLIADLDQAIADTEQRLDRELEQEGAELERQLVAYVKKLELRYNTGHNVALSIGVNTWFEESKPLHVQWMANGNSVSGHDLYAVATVCLPAPVGTYLFRKTATGTCPTLVDGKVEWK